MYALLTRRRLAAGLVALAAGPAVAQPPADPPPATRPSVDGPTLNLGECLGIALDRQPNIRAAQASLAAALAGRQALANIRGVAERLTPELPIRRQQSEQGVVLAAAELNKVRQETTYDVTRLYYTHVYARQQESTALDVIAQLEDFYGVAKDILDAGVRDPKVKINSDTLYGLQDVIAEVKAKRLQATTGKKASIAALKEAMGVDPCYEFTPRDAELPVMGGDITVEQVVRFALCHRPEMAQAAAGAEAFRLEIQAQGKVNFRTIVPTLAAGSDLHAKMVPLSVRNGEYKPGALAPEMPPNLAGKKDDRVARAVPLADRQEAVSDKIRNLITLEATAAHVTFAAATERMAEAKRRFEVGKKRLEDSRVAASARQDPELLVRVEGAVGKAQAEYIEAVFEHLKALATIERVTGGAIRPSFPNR